MRRYLPITVLLLAFWGGLLINADEPFYGVQDATRIWIAAAVRNYEAYPGDSLLPIRDLTTHSTGELSYYSHHPPLAIWLASLTSELFGYHELGIRYGYIAFTLVSAAAMYVIARRLYGAEMALWTAGFYAITPMVAYFGRVPGYNYVGLAFAFLYVAILLNWLHQPHRARYLALIVLAVLCVWTAWAAVFFVAACGLAAMWLGKNTHRIGVIGLGITTIVAFAALMTFYQSQWSGAIDSILEAFVWRTSDATLRPGSESFTAMEWLARILVQSIALITPSLLILGVWGMFMLRGQRFAFANVMVLALFAAGFGYQLAFRNASYIHDYYKVFLVPAIALTAAAAIVYGRHQRRFRRFARPAIDGLLLATVLISVFIIWLLHNTGDKPWLQAIIETVDTRIPAETQVMANFNKETTTGNAMAIEYYTDRIIRWGIPPEDLQATSETPIVYIYCDIDESGLPQTLAERDPDVIYEDTCWLVDGG